MLFNAIMKALMHFYVDKCFRRLNARMVKKRPSTCEHNLIGLFTVINTFQLIISSDSKKGTTSICQKLFLDILSHAQFISGCFDLRLCGCMVEVIMLQRTDLYQFKK